MNCDAIGAMVCFHLIFVYYTQFILILICEKNFELDGLIMSRIWPIALIAYR